ncbi:MAG: hypothetical protein AABY40_02385 [Nanoarchaeota archaeon]
MKILGKTLKESLLPIKYYIIGAVLVVISSVNPLKKPMTVVRMIAVLQLAALKTLEKEKKLKTVLKKKRALKKKKSRNLKQLVKRKQKASSKR